MLLLSFLNNLLILPDTFNPIAGLVFPIGIPSKEAKAENEIPPVIVEARIRKCLV